MKSKHTYTVITVDGSVVGPISSNEIADLVTAYLIGPDSQIRHGDDGDWASFADVALSIGIELPSAEQWNLDRQAFQAKETEDKSNLMLGCGLVLLMGLGIAVFTGFGILIIPLIGFCLMFVIFCKIMNLFCDVDVLTAPMWTDVRDKPAEGSQLQFLAMVLAMISVGSYYFL